MNTITASKVRRHLRGPNLAHAGFIRYGIGTCTLGALLVARDEQGICAIFLGNDAADLLEQLHDAFVSNSTEEASTALSHDLAQVAAFIDEPKSGTVLELSVGGTAFQQKVWQALCEIPAGSTRSYADIASAVGDPGAVRAVASACAANVLAVAIPCHRVIRSDGSISGYRWGEDRKRWLLQQEKQK